MIQKLPSDPIPGEIHRTRREMSERFDGDSAAMLDHARRRQKASGHPIWQPRHDEQSHAPEPALRPVENGESPESQ